MSVVEKQIKEALKEKQPTLDLFKVILSNKFAISHIKDDFQIKSG